ncbi:MAG: XRE family transcriptional regulator [Treponemataceae bacterium]
MNAILVRIKKLITHLQLSDSSFAEKIGIGQTTLSAMFQRNSDPRSETLKSIIERYHVNPDWLLTGNGAMFQEKENLPSVQSVKIPILTQKVSCGSGVSWEAEQNVSEYLDIANLAPALKNKKIYGFRVKGTSMLGAGIKDGDIVVFSSDQEFSYDDGIYVFSLDGDVYCKRLEFDPIASKVKIYSVRVADLEKAELLTTLTSADSGFEERFSLFGKVHFWIHRTE